MLFLKIPSLPGCGLRINPCRRTAAHCVLHACQPYTWQPKIYACLRESHSAVSRTSAYLHESGSVLMLLLKVSSFPGWKPPSAVGLTLIAFYLRARPSWHPLETDPIHSRAILAPEVPLCMSFTSFLHPGLHFVCYSRRSRFLEFILCAIHIIHTAFN